MFFASQFFSVVSCWQVLLGLLDLHNGGAARSLERHKKAFVNSEGLHAMVLMAIAFAYPSRDDFA